MKLQFFKMNNRVIGIYTVNDFDRSSPPVPRTLSGSAVGARRWDLAHRRIEALERASASLADATRAPIQTVLAELRQLVQAGIEKEFELATAAARALLVRVLQGLSLVELRADAEASARND